MKPYNALFGRESLSAWRLETHEIIYLNIYHRSDIKVSKFVECLFFVEHLKANIK